MYDRIDTKDLIRVEILEKEKHDGLCHFGFTGLGWIKPEDVNKNYILVALDDTYKGCRGYNFDKKYVKILK